jgi:calcium permeable stress-gated cation channel
MVCPKRDANYLTIATGGGGQTGLDILSFANISGNTDHYFAQVLVGWLILSTNPTYILLIAGFTLWYLTRELIKFRDICQDYLRRPKAASKVAQRTILLTAIPKESLSVERLTEIFGPHVEKVWINRNHKALNKLVEERNKGASILENVETKLMKKFNKIAIEKGQKEVSEGYEKPISTLYIKDEKGPTHKLGYSVIKFLFGKKVSHHSLSILIDSSLCSVLTWY